MSRWLEGNKWMQGERTSDTPGSFSVDWWPTVVREATPAEMVRARVLQAVGLELTWEAVCGSESSPGSSEA